MMMMMITGHRSPQCVVRAIEDPADLKPPAPKHAFDPADTSPGLREERHILPNAIEYEHVALLVSSNRPPWRLSSTGDEVQLIEGNE